MPTNEYFKGHGDEVMSNMQKEYGSEKGKQVFYATANKKGQTTKKKSKHKAKKKLHFPGMKGMDHGKGR